METSDWTFKHKPYDLRERLFIFACAITRLVQYLHTRGPVAIELSAQLLNSGTSAAANYEEADDGSSTADRVAKTLTAAHDPVIAENTELVKIVATIIRNSTR